MTAEAINPNFSEPLHELLLEDAKSIAERAHMDVWDLQGALKTDLHGNVLAPIDTHDLRNIDGNGLIMIFGIGESAIKLYKHTEDHGDGPQDHFRITSGDYLSENLDNHAGPINFEELEKDVRTIIGRETKFTGPLGITEDHKTSRKHFEIKVTSQGIVTVTDTSTYGTEVVCKPFEKTTLSKVVHTNVLGKLFGRQVVKPH